MLPVLTPPKALSLLSLQLQAPLPQGQELKSPPLLGLPSAPLLLLEHQKEQLQQQELSKERKRSPSG